MVDWANVHGWSSDPESRNYLGWKVDPTRLFQYLGTYPEIFDKMLYYGVDVDKDWSKELKNNFERIGFNMQSKEVKWVPASLRSHFKKLVKELFDVLATR
jgi:hypothetical protein